MVDVLAQVLFWALCGFCFAQLAWRLLLRPRSKTVCEERQARRKARNAQGRASGFGWCRCCGDTWDWKVIHVTPVSRASLSALFPLCEECWQRLEKPENRWPYYEALINEWEYGARSAPGFARFESYREALGMENTFPDLRQKVYEAVRSGL